MLRSVFQILGSRCNTVVSKKHSMLFLAFLVSGCAAKKLNVTEVCIINGMDRIAECRYLDGSERQKEIVEIDKYTSFSPENSSKILKYVQKCLKSGISP